MLVQNLVNEEDVLPDGALHGDDESLQGHLDGQHSTCGLGSTQQHSLWPHQFLSTKAWKMWLQETSLQSYKTLPSCNFFVVCNFLNIKTLITIVILALDTDAFMDVFDKAGDIDNVIGSGRYDAKVIILVILVIWRTLACFDCHLKVVDTH